MKLLQFIYGPHNSVLQRAIGRRYFAATATDAYAKRNYASNESEYKTVFDSLTKQRRHYLLRDAYDDMVLDGVQPSRDAYNSLIVGTMKGARLQDAFFFRDEMKAMGLVPDVFLYNLLISTCGKCENSDLAIRILEEMKIYEVKPNAQTYVCLLNACAVARRLDRVYAIVRDMTAAGAGLNMFCYSGLILAHVNKSAMSDNTAAKIVELVEQSKGWSSVEASSNNPENQMMGIFEEELYNLPTSEYASRRGGFLSRQLTVYHAAFYACAELKNMKATDTLLDMLKKDGQYPDVFSLMQIMRCYLKCKDIDRGLKVFEDYMMNSRRNPFVELFATLVEGAMTGYTERGMQLAYETLVKMNSMNVFLNPKMGSDLLLVAAREKSGGYTTANYIWDLMQARRMIPTFPAVDAYYHGLRNRLLPEDDPRWLHVSRTYDNLRIRFGAASGARVAGRQGQGQGQGQGQEQEEEQEHEHEHEQEQV